MSAAQQAGGAGYGLARLAEDTRERFVREIVARVPVERIVEVHFFAPIRQGGVETGVAVVAAVQLPSEGSVEPPAEDQASAGAVAVPTRDQAPVPQESAAEAPPTAATANEETPELETLGDATVDVPPATAAADVAADAEAPAACDPTDDAAGPLPSGPGAEDGPPADAAFAAEPSVAASAAPEGVTWSDATEEPPLDTASMDEVLGEEVPVDVEAAPSARVAWPRHTVFTARYRLTLKGPDRGRWLMDVVEEADAPLVTVEAVVRGVQRRAGDAVDTERLTAADVAAIVARAPATATTPAPRGGSAR